jgi:hypothetical protein
MREKPTNTTNRLSHGTVIPNINLNYVKGPARTAQ